MRSVLLLLTIAVGACTVTPAPVPDPKPAPEPAPVPVEPDDAGLRPYPDSACGAACRNLDALGCPGAGPLCVEACDRYEALAVESPVLSWHPSCLARARTCAETEACR